MIKREYINLVYKIKYLKNKTNLKSFSFVFRTFFLRTNDVDGREAQTEENVYEI